MKIFCAYAFTGEDLAEIRTRMKSVISELKLLGHAPYTNLFDAESMKLQEAGDIKGLFQAAFAQVMASDCVVALVTSPRISLGQIMEVGVALSQNKPVYLFEHTSAAESTYLPILVEKTLSWTSEEELLQALKEQFSPQPAK